MGVFNKLVSLLQDVILGPDLFCLLDLSPSTSGSRSNFNGSKVDYYVQDLEVDNLLLWPYLSGRETRKCYLVVFVERRGNSFCEQHMYIYPCVKHQTDHVWGPEGNLNQHKAGNHISHIHCLQHNPSRKSQKKLVPTPNIFTQTPF